MCHASVHCAFAKGGGDVFQAPTSVGVPGLSELGRLLQVTERILCDQETDEDLQLIFAPGSSLGGARPKGFPLFTISIRLRWIFVRGF
jgi:hypothetical protein